MDTDADLSFAVSNSANNAPILITPPAIEDIVIVTDTSVLTDTVLFAEPVPGTPNGTDFTSGVSFGLVYS